MKKKRLQKTAKCQKGAMDSILATILLVLLAVGVIVGLSTWFDTQKDSVTNAATIKISDVTSEISDVNNN